MTCHCCRGIIQHHQRHICLIIKRIDDPRYARREKRRVSHKSKTLHFRIHMENTLGNVDSRSHAKTSIAHIQRRCISQCITADISAINGFLPLHGFFYSQEGCPVRAAGAKYRRPNWKSRHLLLLLLFPRSSCTLRQKARIACPTESTVFSPADAISPVNFPRILTGNDISTYSQQSTFNDRIQFFHAQHFIQSVKKRHGHLLRKRKRCRYVEQTNRLIRR